MKLPLRIIDFTASARYLLLFLQVGILLSTGGRIQCFQMTTPHRSIHHHSTLSHNIYWKKHTTSLCMTPMQTLKPGAVSLLEAGKALARYGELIIDVSTTTTSYMGFSWKAFTGDDGKATTSTSGDIIITRELSPYIAAMGACIRTAGDSIAQAGALMRFKTGHELVVVELRDASFSICHQLEDGSMKDSVNTGTSMGGVTSAWAKAIEALDEINERMKDTNSNNVMEWEQVQSVMVTTIPIYFKLGKCIELIGVRIVENASAEEIGRIFLDMSKAVEALSQVSPIFNHHKTEIWNESQLSLSQASRYFRETGVSLGAKLDDNHVNKSKGMNKGWMKNSS